MKILGFQKLTLLDYPGKTAATVFTGGCNFRCPFCHNGELVLSPDTVPVFDEDEVISTLSRRKGFLDGVCVTGGEPLAWNTLGEFIKKIKDTGLLVKLDTNGSFPSRLDALLKENLLDYVAMDVKSSAKEYSKAVGLPAFDTAPICESVEIIKGAQIDKEFRTTVVSELHSDTVMEDISLWLKGDVPYFLQAYRLSDGVIDKSLTPPSKQDLLRYLEIVKKHLPLAQIRGVE